MIMGEGNLYKLNNGNILRVYSSANNPNYEYGWDYFDWTTRRLIDGGVFSVEDPDLSEEEAAEIALDWCDAAGQSFTLIATDVDYESLEFQGYSGF